MSYCFNTFCRLTLHQKMGPFDLNNSHFGFDLSHLSKTPYLNQSVLLGEQVQGWQTACGEGFSHIYIHNTSHPEC